MSKILAIKGHESRYEEVIKILEMLGGKNPHNYMADCNRLCFYIDSKYNIIYYDWLYETEDKIIFTLEEFLEKYPFKVGDKVFLYDNITEGCVTGMEWDKDKGTVKYCVYTSAEYRCDVKELLKWNNIDLVEKHYMDNMGKKIAIKGNSIRGDEVIKLVEMMGVEKDKNLEEVQSPQDNSIFIMEHSMWPIVKDSFLEYKIVEGYEFDKIENGNIILKPIKPKYPKTYEECCELLDILGNINIEGYKKELLLSFQKLLICRDAYWKIAGEQMGLGKPWEPDWKNHEFKCCIKILGNTLQRVSEMNIQCTLAFPTEEMRDFFFGNFKKEIEECKELL